MSKEGESNPEIAKEIAKKDFFRILRDASVKVKRLYEEADELQLMSEERKGKYRERARILIDLPKQIRAIPGAEDFFVRQLTFIDLISQDAVEALKTDSWIMLGGLLIPRGVSKGDVVVDELEVDINSWSKELGE